MSRPDWASSKIRTSGSCSSAAAMRTRCSSLWNRPRSAPAGFGQVQKFEQFVGLLCNLIVRHTPQAASELQVFEAGEITVQIRLLGHIAKAFAKPDKIVANVSALVKDLPSEGWSRPANISTVVDLPDPFGPRYPVISPGRMAKLTRSTTVEAPKRLVRLWASSMQIQLMRSVMSPARFHR